MKIGILTHPLISNYGGILQCYALNTYLQKMGHETIVIDRRSNKGFIIWRWIRFVLQSLHFPRYYKPQTIDKTIKVCVFVNQRFNKTEQIESSSQMMKICKSQGLDAVIVGSDQVWRYSYAMRFGFNYFLDFVPNDIVKLSYAASFGISEWQYNHKQTKRIRELLSKFSGISVREKEAVHLLQKNIGIKSVQLIDPTFLLTTEDYDKIASPALITDKYIFVYWLGDKSHIMLEIEQLKAKGNIVKEVYLRDCEVQISVEDWLSYIKYANLVITDSFHGCVFSIIYERQFKLFHNDSGGNGRIATLCSMFGIDFKSEKDYSNTQSIIHVQQSLASDFLRESLSIVK